MNLEHSVMEMTGLYVNTDVLDQELLLLDTEATVVHQELTPLDVSAQIAHMQMMLQDTFAILPEYTMTSLE